MAVNSTSAMHAPEMLLHNSEVNRSKGSHLASSLLKELITVVFHILNHNQHNKISPRMPPNLDYHHNSACPAFASRESRRQGPRRR